MTELTLAQRKSYDLEGLQELISKVFTDADASGENGPEYYVWNGNRKTSFNEYLSSLVKDWYDSYYDERTIIRKAFDSYKEFCGNYYCEMEYEKETNKENQVTCLAIAKVV